MKYLISLLAIVCIFGCKPDTGNPFATEDPVSSSGVSKMTVTVPVDSSGRTTEQKNISERLIRDNKPGSIKYLYITNLMNGQLLYYSTVNGKITSGGKRLTPSSVVAGYASGEYNSGWYGGFDVNIGGTNYKTGEVLEDDGTYGSSIPYFYWFDVTGVYHQHYQSAMEDIHISDQPLAIKTSSAINLDVTLHK